MALFEIHRREASTEAGKAQLEYEKQVALMDAYGGMYMSLTRGREFCRMAVAVCCVLEYDFEDDEDEDE